MSTYPPSILDNTLADAITFEPLEANTDPTLNSGIDPSPGRHPRFPFTLNRILLGVIPFASVASKFIDSHFYGAPIAATLLDFIPAIFVFILYWCSLYEGDPPLRLQWLLDTDWDYVFDVGKRWSVVMKNNPLETWSVIVLVYSTTLASGGIIVHQSRMYRRERDILVTLSGGMYSLGCMAIIVALTISGVSKHQAHTYRKFSIIVIGVLFQIGSLVIGTWVVSFIDNLNPFFTWVAGYVSLLGGLLVFSIGRTADLLSKQVFFWSYFLCMLGSCISLVAWVAPYTSMIYGTKLVGLASIVLVGAILCLIYIPYATGNVTLHLLLHVVRSYLFHLSNS